MGASHGGIVLNMSLLEEGNDFWAPPSNTEVHMNAPQTMHNLVPFPIMRLNKYCVLTIIGDWLCMFDSIILNTAMCNRLCRENYLPFLQQKCSQCELSPNLACGKSHQVFSLCYA